MNRDEALTQARNEKAEVRAAEDQARAEEIFTGQIASEESALALLRQEVLDRQGVLDAIKAEAAQPEAETPAEEAGESFQEEQAEG